MENPYITIYRNSVYLTVIFMKCKHERISIKERADWITSHDREKNGEWSSHNDIGGSYADVVSVNCHDCKKTWRYSRMNAPQWLNVYLDEIGI